MKYSEIEIMFKNGKSLAVTCEKCIVKTQNSTVHDYDLRFHAEDLGMVPTDRRFRWKMLTSKVQAACVVDDRKKTIFDILERSKHHE